jgi:hypothetical protein
MSKKEYQHINKKECLFKYSAIYSKDTALNTVFMAIQEIQPQYFHTYM